MADGLNRVLLLGNLGADPELRVIQSGDSLLKLRLATSESWLDKNRVRQERTEWHTVIVWGKRAEALSKFLSKGSKIFVEGKITTNSYDDKDGNKRYSTQIVAQNIILCGSSRDREGHGSKSRDEGRERADRRGGGQRQERDDSYDNPDYGGGDYGNDDDPIPF